MKKMIIPAALLLSSLLSPAFPAWAGHDMGSMAGMKMDGDSTAIMLESVQQDGVMAMAHLYELGASMAKEGKKETHHMMVMFTGTQDGKAITQGTVAVKVAGPSGTKGEPIKMMLMGDGFGANIALPTPGKYTLEVGSKLADAKKRVFTFSYDKK
jgi:hypothetical protein